MSLRFPSDEWVAEFERQINASPDYKASSLTWEAGPIALVAENVPGLELEEVDIAIWLDLLHGECRQGKLATVGESATASFEIRGTYALWKQILLKEVRVVNALMQGKLKVRGSMATLMKYMKGAQDLVECATRVPTQFLDQ